MGEVKESRLPTLGMLARAANLQFFTLDPETFGTIWGALELAGYKSTATELVLPTGGGPNATRYFSVYQHLPV
jgi:hypothetical protein